MSDFMSPAEKLAQLDREHEQKLPSLWPIPVLLFLLLALCVQASRMDDMQSDLQLERDRLEAFHRSATTMVWGVCGI